AAVSLREHRQSAESFEQIERRRRGPASRSEYYTDKQYSERLHGQRHRREGQRDGNLRGQRDQHAAAGDEQDVNGGTALNEALRDGLGNGHRSSLFITRIAGNSVIAARPLTPMPNVEA